MTGLITAEVVAYLCLGLLIGWIYCVVTGQ